MKYAIIVDSTSSLPSAVLKQRPIKTLPVPVHIDGEDILDLDDEKKLVEMYQSGRINQTAKIYTTAPTPLQIRKFILNRIVPEYDLAICQTVSSEFSPLYSNITEVAMHISKSAREARKKLRINTPFRMITMSSGTSVAGQGLVAFYADVILDRGLDIARYQIKIERFKKSVKGYVVIQDLLYSRKKAEERGIEPLSFSAALFGRLFRLSPIVLTTNDHLSLVGRVGRFKRSVDHLMRYAVDRIKEGLIFQAINISIAGPVEELQEYPAFKELEYQANQANVVLLIGVMSLTASIHYGSGAIAIGIAPFNFDAEPT